MKTKSTQVKLAVFQTAAFLFLFLFSNFSTKSQNIQGSVFEDKNYGGGFGRSLSASSGISLQSAIVELYDASGNFLQTTTTDGSGNYNFTGLGGGTYNVRVVNASVRSARPGYINGLFAVQTFNSEALVAGLITQVQNKVGGQIPAEQDAPANTSSLSLSSLNAVAGQEV